MKKEYIIAVALIAIALQAHSDSTNLQPPEGIQYRPVTLVQLGVKDLSAAILFYTEKLGFVVTERRDDLKFAHLATNVDGLQIGLSEQPKTGKRFRAGKHRSCECRIGTENARIKRRCIQRGNHDHSGQSRSRRFADPDGNRLRFAGPPPPDQQ